MHDHVDGNGDVSLWARWCGGAVETPSPPHLCIDELEEERRPFNPGLGGHIPFSLAFIGIVNGAPPYYAMNSLELRGTTCLFGSCSGNFEPFVVIVARREGMYCSASVRVHVCAPQREDMIETVLYFYHLGLGALVSFRRSKVLEAVCRRRWV